MSHESVIDLVENDTLPELLITYEDVDLSDYTAFKLAIKYKPDALIKDGVLVDALTGQFKFTWDTGDLRAGRWPAQIELTDGDGKILTFTGLTLNIEAEIVETSA